MNLVPIPGISAVLGTASAGFALAVSTAVSGGDPESLTMVERYGSFGLLAVAVLSAICYIVPKTVEKIAAYVTKQQEIQMQIYNEQLRINSDIHAQFLKALSEERKTHELALDSERAQRANDLTRLIDANAKNAETIVTEIRQSNNITANLVCALNERPCQSGGRVLNATTAQTLTLPK
jgi:hypothetical protein